MFGGDRFENLYYMYTAPAQGTIFTPTTRTIGKNTCYLCIYSWFLGKRLMGLAIKLFICIRISTTAHRVCKHKAAPLIKHLAMLVIRTTFLVLITLVIFGVSFTSSLIKVDYQTKCCYYYYYFLKLFISN